MQVAPRNETRPVEQTPRVPSDRTFVVDDFVIEAENVSIASKVLLLLREERVNFRALGIAPLPDGRLRIDAVPESRDAFLHAARDLGLRHAPPRAVFLVEGTDRIGVVAEILLKLAAAGAGVESLCAIRAAAGAYGLLFHVPEAEVARAARALGL